MEFDFSHNTLFLTGGGGGIGSAIKESFLKSGATVISPYSTEMNLLDEDSIVNYIKTLQILSFIALVSINWREFVMLEQT